MKNSVDTGGFRYRLKTSVLLLFCIVVMPCALATGDLKLLRGSSDEESNKNYKIQVSEVLKSKNDFLEKAEMALVSSSSMAVTADRNEFEDEESQHESSMILDAHIENAESIDTNNVLKNDFVQQAKMASLTGSTVLIDQSKGIMLSNGENGLDSNLQDKKSLLDNDVGTALNVAPSFQDQYHELPVTLYEGDSCEQVKTHAAVGTAIIAGIATIAGLFLDPFGSAARIAIWIAGLSTAGNGLTNYISCDGSDFIMDSKQVEAIAKKVFNTGTAAGLRTEVTDAFARFDNSILFQQSLSTLKDRIGYFSSIVSRMKQQGVDIETADLMFTVTAYLSSLYQLSIFKKGSSDEKQGDPDPGSSIQSEDGDTCVQYMREYRDIVHIVKQHMDQHTWARQSAEFTAATTCDKTSVSSFMCGPCDPGACYRDPGRCRRYKIVCSATYGGNTYRKDSSTWQECSGDECGSNGHHSSPAISPDKNKFMTEEFKPKFDAWYNKIKDDWDKLKELDTELQRFTNEQAEDTMCGKYKKPLCMPYFFYDADIEYCCDNEESLRCGNFEGTCSTTRNECKDGFVCRPLNDILRERASDETLILQRTAWKKGDNPNVCYKAGEPIPGPFEEDAITPYPTSNPTSSPSKSPITPPPPPSCFSSKTQIPILHKGVLPVSEIEIGDYAQSKTDGSFSRVYVFEKNHDGKSEFLQIHSSTDTLLELTDRHMLYLKNNPIPIPAGRVRVGDVLETIEDSGAQVEKIEIIQREGYYAPHTEDGTIIVNNIMTSSYSTAKPSAPSFLYGDNKVLSFQNMVNIGLSPLRFTCKAVWFGFCSEEKFQDENGFHMYNVFLDYFSGSPILIQLIFFPIIFGMGVIFSVLELFYDQGEAFYKIVASSLAEAGSDRAASSVESSSIIITFSLTVVVAALVPSAIFLWRKKYQAALI